jgi:hypothetical protein
MGCAPNATEDEMVRCKMIVIEKKNMINQWGGDLRPRCAVKLAAVSGDENKTWASATPSGSIELQIDNPNAYDAFVLGQTYFVDLAPVREADEAR